MSLTACDDLFKFLCMELRVSRVEVGLWGGRRIKGRHYRGGQENKTSKDRIDNWLSDVGLIWAASSCRGHTFHLRASRLSSACFHYRTKCYWSLVSTKQSCSVHFFTHETVIFEFPWLKLWTTPIEPLCAVLFFITSEVPHLYADSILKGGYSQPAGLGGSSTAKWFD